VPRINKSAEVLKVIAGKRVIVEDELTTARSLLSLFGANARRRIIDTAALLTKQGFISIGTIEHEKLYKVTDKGLRHLDLYLLGKKGIAKPREWQGSFYIVTFEIPDAQKVTRNYLVAQLKLQGFVNYTKGLWVYPYDPTEYVRGLKKLLGLQKEIKLITASALDGEASLKQAFGLK
jgi:phenylacetic acid degradation operon negative regulatory protein